MSRTERLNTTFDLASYNNSWNFGVGISGAKVEDGYTDLLDNDYI